MPGHFHFVWKLIEGLQTSLFLWYLDMGYTCASYESSLTNPQPCLCTKKRNKLSAPPTNFSLAYERNKLNKDNKSKRAHACFSLVSLVIIIINDLVFIIIISSFNSVENFTYVFHRSNYLPDSHETNVHVRMDVFFSFVLIFMSVSLIFGDHQSFHDSIH